MIQGQLQKILKTFKEMMASGSVVDLSQRSQGFLRSAFEVQGKEATENQREIVDL